MIIFVNKNFIQIIHSSSIGRVVIEILLNNKIPVEMLSTLLMHEEVLKCGKMLQNSDRDLVINELSCVVFQILADER